MTKADESREIVHKIKLARARAAITSMESQGRSRIRLEGHDALSQRVADEINAEGYYCRYIYMCWDISIPESTSPVVKNPKSKIRQYFSKFDII